MQNSISNGGQLDGLKLIGFGISERRTAKLAMSRFRRIECYARYPVRRSRVTTAGGASGRPVKPQRYAMNEVDFRIVGRECKFPEHSFVVEIAPKAGVWRDPYVGIRLNLVALLRPRLAIGPCDQPPTDQAAYSDLLVLGAESPPVVRLFAGQDVDIGQAVFLLCTVPPAEFVFGTRDGIEYRSGPSATAVPTLEEWLQTSQNRQASQLFDPASPPAIHPSAAQAFNARAAALVSRLTDVPLPLPKVSAEKRVPAIDIHTGPTIIVTGALRTEIPVLDDRGLKSVSDEKGRLTLLAADYVEFRRLAEALHKKLPWVSTKFIEKHLFEWLVATKRNEHDSTEYCTHLRAAAIDAARPYEVWIPLYRVFTEMDFPIGHTVCRTMSREFFDRALERDFDRATDDTKRDLSKRRNDRTRRDHQGHAALVVSVRAEPDRAVAFARDVAQQAADVLRLFDSAMVHTDAPSTCVLFGDHFEPHERALVMKQGVLHISNQQLVDPYRLFKVGRNDLTQFLGLGLPAWDAAVRATQRTEFQTAALSSLALYTTAATKRDVSDRLVYTFAAIESLLIKDAREPLTQNIADRLALATAHSASARKKVATTVKDAYGIRSRFVHHGASPENEIVIGEFLRVVWRFYVLPLPTALSEFTRRLDFVEWLDDLKYEA